MRRLSFRLILVLAGLCGRTALAAPELHLVFGADVSPVLKQRITALLQPLSPQLDEWPADKLAKDLANPEAMVLAFGQTVLGQQQVSAAELAALGSEGFVLRSASLGRGKVLAAIGNPNGDDAQRHGNIGTHYAAYALLEQLGFAFLRPMAPTSPSALHWPEHSVDQREKPRWRVRAMHVHTQHPLELTNLLQGWGKDPADRAGFNAMLGDWQNYLEWLLANRQNRVEWALLWAASWQDFAGSDDRLARLRLLVNTAHDFGLSAGVDVPIAFAQQHAFRLLRQQGVLADEVVEIRGQVDWLMRAGFDFLGTETGASEFTHPASTSQLAWMNALARYTADTYHKPVYIKVHCSSGQTAEGFTDPLTGQPLNFNMLPQFADAKMGVLPHTVEFYGLDDPAPVYGNDTFNYMRTFLQQEVGKREVVWYPETAYWVNYDIDLPLFLPLYAERRVHDLRLLGGDEEAGRMGRGVHAGARMDGQLNFSSGWEWGYWLNDAITARAAWNPELEQGSDAGAFKRVAVKTLGIFGPATDEVVAWLSAVTAAENALLIRGEIARQAPQTVALRNGQAYLQGFDAWADITALVAKLGAGPGATTQPARLGTLELAAPLLQTNPPDYQTELEPLLAAMEEQFGALAEQGRQLTAKVPPDARALMADLADAAAMTALRAKQQHGLYDYAAWNGDRSERLGTARQALDDAAAIVARREAHYALQDRQRITAWQAGPTAYNYGYLWTVHTLYYWWRDEAKVVQEPRSPCFMNIINGVDVAFGEGRILDVSRWLGGIAGSEYHSCLDAPAREPGFPPQGLR